MDVGVGDGTGALLKFGLAASPAVTEQKGDLEVILRVAVKLMHVTDVAELLDCSVECVEKMRRRFSQAHLQQGFVIQDRNVFLPRNHSVGCAIGVRRLSR